MLTTERGILGGAAQHLTRSALLHHGTLPRQVDRSAHRAIFDAEERSVFDRLIGTEDLGFAHEPEVLRDELARAIAHFLETGGADAQPVPRSAQSVSAARSAASRISFHEPRVN